MLGAGKCLSIKLNVNNSKKYNNVNNESRRILMESLMAYKTFSI